MGILGICDLVLFSGCSRVKLLNLVFSGLDFVGFVILVVWWLSGVWVGIRRNFVWNLRFWVFLLVRGFGVLDILRFDLAFCLTVVGIGGLVFRVLKFVGFVFLSFGGRLWVWCCCKTKFLVILGVRCVFLYLGKILILVGLVIYFYFLVDADLLFGCFRGWWFWWFWGLVWVAEFWVL